MKFAYLVPLCALLCIGCKKGTTSIATEDSERRNQFVGKCKVIDANPPFYFSVSKVDSTDGKEYIKLTNFANLFNLVYEFDNNHVPRNEFTIITPYPVKDKHGNRWDFGLYENPNVPDNLLLHDDTLRVYFRIQNAPWYVDDDTIGIDKFYLQTAVKIK